jgi:hypothetical protein
VSAFSIVALGVPLVVFWLLLRSPDSRRRTLLMTVAGLAALPYFGIWLYTVTLLSYLSLPLVIVVGGTAGCFACLARKALLKAGVAESRLVGAARVSAWIVAALAGLGVVALVVLNSRLREQLLRWLPPKDVVQVNVLRSVGWGGLTGLSQPRRLHLLGAHRARWRLSVIGPPSGPVRP